MRRKGIPGGPVIGSECFKNKVKDISIGGPRGYRVLWLKMVRALTAI